MPSSRRSDSGTEAASLTSPFLEGGLVITCALREASVPKGAGLLSVTGIRHIVAQCF